MSEEQRCPGCGRAMGPEDRFCSSCGTRLAGPTADPEWRRPTREDLFAHLRSSEKRPAAILMADLSGYSTFSEQADPEWVFSLLNGVFNELVECLLAYGAHIDKYMGDEVLALFGVPRAQERSIERAVRAALAMRQRMQELNREGRFGSLHLGLHMGLHVGPVMVGPVGHRDHADYTVIGDTVNVTKRLEDQAPEGEIYVSQAVRDAVADLFDFEEIGPVALPGRRQQAQVFRLLGARGQGERASSLLDVPGEPWMGREGELQELLHQAASCLAGSPACVCISGPPGSGKSRLIAHWRRSPEAQRFRTVGVACYAFGEHFPLLPVVELVTQWAGLRLEGWPPRVAGDLSGSLADLPVSPSARESLARLLQDPASPPGESDPGWRDGLGASLTELLRGMGEEQPLCLILEDVQWLDEASRSLLAEVFAEGQGGPVFLLLSAREEGVAWVEETLKGSRIPLPPLPRSVMERLIEAWAGPLLLPRSMVRAICDRAQGQPYFARELVRSLHHPTGAVWTDAGSLPHTLQELFLAQLDRLPRPLRYLVQAASVVGEPLSYTLLETALGEESWLTSAVLTEAVKQDLLRAGAGPGQFAFGRRLLFEVAYNTLPPSQQQELHARIATRLVEQEETLGETAVHAAAHHAYLGYRDERALDLLLRSARQYRAQYANWPAIREAQRVIEVISAVPSPKRFLDQRLEALFFLSIAYEIVGDLGAAEGALAEAEVLAQEGAQGELVAQITYSAAALRFMQGRWGEAERGFERTREAWELMGNATRVAQALLGLGMCAWKQGQREQALRCYDQAVNQGGEEPWIKAAALNNAGIVLLEEGRYAEAEPYFVEALRANEAAGDRRGIANCQASLGELNLRQGRFPEAENWLRQAVEEAEDMEDAECGALASAFLARSLVAQGRPQQASEVLRQGESFLSLVNDRYTQNVVRLANLEVRSVTPDWPGVLEEIGALDLCAGEGRDWAAGHLANIQAETLALGLEVALQHQQLSIAARLAALLQALLSSIVDHRLRQFAHALLAWEEKGEVPIEPLPGPAQQGDFFVTRLENLNGVNTLSTKERKP